MGEADIRATGQGQGGSLSGRGESLGAQGYTVMQLMQIVGERNVRIVPDVAVTWRRRRQRHGGWTVGMMLRHQTEGDHGGQGKVMVC